LEKNRFKENPFAVKLVANMLHLPMLHGAVLIALARHNQKEELLRIFAESSFGWMQIRTLLALHGCDALSADEDQRLRLLIAGTSDSVQLTLNRIWVTKHSRKQASAIVEAEHKPTPRAEVRLNSSQARQFLNSTGRFDERAIVIDCDEEELRALVVDLDPARDTEWKPAIDPAPPRLSLSATSWQLKNGFALVPSSPHLDQRSALRPAIAAANRFGLDIAWHQAELDGALGERYADRFVSSLGARSDRDSFVQMCRQDPEKILPLLGTWGRARQVLHLVDERLLPMLDRFIQAGQGTFFQAMCTLILQIKTEAVLPSLTLAFRRWIALLNQLQSSPDHENSDTDEWRVVWQTMHSMRKHPYFESIPLAKEQLLELLLRHEKLWYSHREDILQMLRNWPPAYLQFESELFRLSPFGHHYEDKVMLYDEVANDLFWRTGGGSGHRHRRIF
jgi:hypothetical protein